MKDLLVFLRGFFTRDDLTHPCLLFPMVVVTLAIENGNPDIKNKIGIALVDRIVRAHREGQKFRVIVVMPLMPAFEADIMTTEAGTLRKVMHFQYMSICRGGNSVLERLVANGIDPDQYIGFFGLRSFDRIKHGKFDAIVEAVKEEERRNAKKRSSNKSNSDDGKGDGGNSGTSSPADSAEERPSASTSKQEGTNSNGVKAEEGVSRGRSLASKFLLDPIPKNEEAARIKEIADRRRAIDVLRTWDESITKKAMNPAMKEHGYVPVATEHSLAEREMNEEIQRDTTEAEIEAGHNRDTSGGDSPKLMDNLGTMVRSAIEMVKGNKEGGDLEPTHHKISRNPHLQRFRHQHRDSDDDSVQAESQSDSKDIVGGGGGLLGGGFTTRRASIEDEKRSIKEDAEAIIEPSPGGSGGDAPQKQGSSSDDSGTADPSKFPNADTVQPVEIERPIVDDEVDDFVTEQLYIHSKLMIVDDRIIICGSGMGPCSCPINIIAW